MAHTGFYVKYVFSVQTPRLCPTKRLFLPGSRSDPVQVPKNG
ncbi:hypothetical protein ACT3S9_19920 [Pseudoalteromonas sp. AOP31-A2-14]